MSDLRSRCLTAMAPYACHLEHTGKALDRLLAVLAERADEWADWNAAECADADEGCNCVSDEQVLGLLEVLKPTTEEDRK